MDIESIGFAVQTTVLGMLIVFGFLSFLAVSMKILSSLFKDKHSSVSLHTNGNSKVTSNQNISGATKDHVNNPDMLGVVVAAAAAFVEHEQRSSEVSAAPWSGNTFTQNVR